jgi:hypothetical protein
MHTLLAHARRASPELTETVNQLAAVLGVRPPLVEVLPGLGSPLVWAIGPARLFWPAGLEEGLSADGLRAVLVHELAHLRRRDHWVGWLVLAAGCLWWWHPLLWLVRRRLHREAELACDAWVVATMPTARRAYAEALLAVCQRWSLPAEAAPALGAAGQLRDLERRLFMVMREQVPYRLSLRVVLGVGALALLSIPAFTPGQDPVPVREVIVAEPPSAITVQAEKVGEATSDRERKIKDLERKVEALLQEIQALRGGDVKALKVYGVATKMPPADKRTVVVPVEIKAHADTNKDFSGKIAVDRVSDPKVAIYSYVHSADVSEPLHEVTLTRATYKLKPAQAESLGKFLSDNIKTSVLETKVEGEGLVVTTTPDMQRVVGQIVALMQGKVPAAHTLSYPKKS